MKIKALLGILGLSACAISASALTTDHFVSEQGAAGGFCLFADDGAADIVVGTNDWPGVTRAATDLQTDFQRVSGLTPALFKGGPAAGTNVILIGTVGKSEIIDRLILEKKLDASVITGKWESFLIQTVRQPMTGVDAALVICGSDKRGTIYGIYDLSEQMGISPWHFFADVPPAQHKKLYVSAGKFVTGPPAVKYRGIFINDEAPDLTGWVKEHYGGYNHGFYTNVFELLLRLRANYLWPAMWDNCFNQDDPLNCELADEYGIVMGTSHVEPMMRADKEWDRAGYTARDWNFQTHSNELIKFWREGIARSRDYESLVTIAMRGKVDTAMSPTANVTLLEDIIAAQRKIIADVHQTNAAAVPQLWALYKEVQEYYEKGMRVPDDVTLLWCDDNFGNLRRVPSVADRQRAGGSGIYYHLDYVGSPRNYKWVNSVSLPQVWEQMNLAHEYGANQIWIANVGHLGHVQLPTEFFLTLAWDPARWPAEKITEFTRDWAGREFGEEFAPQIADIVLQFTKLNARCKPELLSPETYSVVNYGEADKVVADWKAIAAAAQWILDQLPAGKHDAFFELVLYPVKACANLNELYVAAAKNHLYAVQGRARADDYAAEVTKLFQTDAELSDYYNHDLHGGKWNHMMDQTHIGYTRWQQPSSNAMPWVATVELSQSAKMGLAIEGATNVWPDFSGDAVLPGFDKFNQPARFIDVFNQGKTPFLFSAETSAQWIMLSATNGTVEKEQRIWVSINWNKAPQDKAGGFITISSGTNAVRVELNEFNPQEPSLKQPGEFVEADGYVSIEAPHVTKQTGVTTARWGKIDGLGNTLGAMTIFPVTASSVTPPENAPCLEYKMFLFDAGKIKVRTTIAPTLNFVAGRGLRFAVSFDDAPPQVVTAVPENYSVGSGDFNRDWGDTASDNARRIVTGFALEHPGEHTLKFWMVDPGVVLEKIVVDCGGVKPSYLGPPESFHR